jgi:hypothetical protein
MFLCSSWSVKVNRIIFTYNGNVQGAKASRATAAGIKILGKMADLTKSHLAKRSTH